MRDRSTGPTAYMDRKMMMMNVINVVALERLPEKQIRSLKLVTWNKTTQTRIQQKRKETGGESNSVVWGLWLCTIYVQICLDVSRLSAVPVPPADKFYSTIVLSRVGPETVGKWVSV